MTPQKAEKGRLKRTLIRKSELKKDAIPFNKDRKQEFHKWLIKNRPWWFSRYWEMIDAMSKDLAEQRFQADTNKLKERLDAQLELNGSYSAEIAQLKADRQRMIEEIESIHDELDNWNARRGNLCLFCDASFYNGKEGVIHEENCLILRLRELKQVLLEGKERD
jgi:hypothetical protein